MNKKIILIFLIVLFCVPLLWVHAEGEEGIGETNSEIVDDFPVSDGEIHPNAESYLTDGYDYGYENDYQGSEKELTYNLDQYTYTNEDTNFTAVIEDHAALLSDEEKEKLLKEMVPLTEYGYIAFVSISYNPSTVENFADDYYHSHYSTASGTIFIIDMDNRKIYIFSDGDNYRTITSSKAYSITDNVYRYASDEEYYQCASSAYKSILTLLGGGKISEPMRNASNIFVALTLAFFSTFIYVLAKTKIKKATNESIIKNCDITFEIGDTSAEKTGSHRVYSPVSDSSSSGGGGGGGGGGGSSGGGGGHSF